MKSLSEMTVQEYHDYIEALLDLYRKESVVTHKPESFYFDGIKFDKNTPSSCWDWLNKQWEDNHVGR